jgi:hypothetical protein
LNSEIYDLSYDDIRSIARDFLTEHYPSGNIPIPIDRIAEFGLDLHFVPMRGLYKQIKMSAFLAGGLKHIFVDEMQFNVFTEKSRFSLAHEIGHLVLHKAVYDDLPYDSITGFIDWKLTEDPRLVYRLEVQADQFAGLVLVPEPQLLRVCNEVVAKHRSKLTGLDHEANDTWAYLATAVAKVFIVSPITAKIRIDKDKVASLVPLP